MSLQNVLPRIIYIGFMDESPPGRYVFDDFVFDAASGELLWKGSRQRLPEQNARLLTLLLQRPGTLVERGALRSQMWPSGEHLNHDHGISNGINQLRSILRDNPRKPSFIETLPKRGYRFIAEVRFEPIPVEPRLEAAAETPVRAEPVPDLPPPPRIVPARKLRFGLFALVMALLLGVCVGGFFLYRHRQAATVSSRADLILAIAPIQAEGPVAQRLAEPFRLELTDAASQLPGVQVRAANSFGSGPLDLTHLRELSQKLQVDVLLLGRMTAVGNTLDLSFELVRGSDAVHLASFHYSGTPDTLGHIRGEMERDLFRTLSDTKHNQLNPLHSTENSQAYSDYLTARAFLIEHSDESIQLAVQSFRRAIGEDASFAQAYSGLGSASLLLAEHMSTDKEAKYADARSASQRAISLNPRIAEAHATLGFLLFRHDWNAAAAAPELQRAIELEPGQAMHRMMYALLLGNTGHLGEALEQVDRAHASDPLWPPVYLTEAYLAAAARDNTRALAAAATLLRLKPNWTLAHDQNAWALWYAGRHDEAIREWLLMAELEHDEARTALERRGLDVFRRSGDLAYAELKLEAGKAKMPWAHPNDFELAEWQLNAGEKRAALESLGEMIAAHDPEALQIGVSPAYFSLHGDPDFRRLVARVAPAPPA